MKSLSNLSEEELIVLKKWFYSLNKRQQDCIKNGYSTKFAYHIVRLLLEVEQILAEEDLDIQRNSAILKSIRNGEWELNRIREWFANKEKSMETLYATSKLQAYPNEVKIKNILLECLEMHYGSISSIIPKDYTVVNLVNDLREIIAKYEG